MCTVMNDLFHYCKWIPFPFMTCNSCSWAVLAKVPAHEEGKKNPMHLEFLEDPVWYDLNRYTR